MGNTYPTPSDAKKSLRAVTRNKSEKLSSSSWGKMIPLKEDKNEEEDDLLRETNEFEEKFKSWFHGSGAKDEQSQYSIMEDNRRRYRMRLADAEEREKLNLSALPSTKSTSVVDRAVERALLDYHGEPDAISYTAKLTRGVEQDWRARWLTEDFKYRCANTFPFFTWHAASLTAGFTDGLEAAFVSWKKESYTEKVKVKRFFYVNAETAEEVPEEIFNKGSMISPDAFEMYEEEQEKEVVVTDTFWIDQLDPGQNLLWDMKAPLLNINLGQACLVKVEKTLEDLLNMAQAGILDSVTEKELESYRLPLQSRESLSHTVSDSHTFDMGDLNRIELWLWFKRVGCQWKVCFSVRGEKQLSTLKDVNEIFFGGRKVNRLPVVLGTTKLKLWEATGRGLPETIAPVEDEWTAHRNNLNDAAKRALVGQWRLEPTSRVRINDLLNNVVFRANKSEVEKMETDVAAVMNTYRTVESLSQDMSELIPVGMESRSLVPRGTTKTLGATELALGQSNEKLSVQLLVRNQTFFQPLLYLIAQLIFAYETDDTILRVAAAKAGAQPATVNGTVDIRQLDLDVDVSINAGLGSVPRNQKFENGMMVVKFGKELGAPIDTAKVFQEMCALVGFDPNQFIGKVQPELPKADMNLSVSADFRELPPPLQQLLVQRLIQTRAGESNTKLSASLKEDLHNKTQGRPSGKVPDMTGGPQAEAMSIGGQRGR